MRWSFLVSERAIYDRRGQNPTIFRTPKATPAGVGLATWTRNDYSRDGSGCASLFGRVSNALGHSALIDMRSRTFNLRLAASLQPLA